MRYLLAIVLPPIAVLLANPKRIDLFLLNILLTLCFWIPGVIHAILMVMNADADRRHRELLEALKQREEK